MDMKISRIVVKNGPLASDFTYEPKSLSVIYGPNESGKTYLVESILRFLFKTGTRAPVKWKLRAWDYAGKIEIQGLGGSQELTKFGKTGDRLDEKYWSADSRIPVTLSELLVVRAGDTSLSASDGGVDLEVLKRYLSDEQYLDRLDDKIEWALKEAEIENGDIVGGRNKTLVASRSELKTKIESLKGLLDRAAENQDLGKLADLRSQLAECENRREKLTMAQRQHACELDSQLRALDEQLLALPEVSKIENLKQQLIVWLRDGDDLEHTPVDEEEMAVLQKNHAWLEAGIRRYQVSLVQPEMESARWPLYLTALALLSGAVCGLFGLGLAVLASLLVAAGALTYYLKGIRALLQNAGEKAELDRIRSEFEKIFGHTADSLAALTSEQTTLVTKMARLEASIASFQEKKSRLKERKGNLQAELTAMGITKPETDWLSSLEEIHQKRISLQKQRDRNDRELEILAVDPSDFVEETGDTQWSRGAYDACLQRLQEIERQIDKLENHLDTFRSEIKILLSMGSNDLNNILTGLHEAYDTVRRSYRDMTANGMAQICLRKVVEEARSNESERIRDGLARDEIATVLYALTGRYRSIRFDDDGALTVNDGEDEYPLASLSTGAKEQIMLAIRIGFARIVLAGQKGFLVLDDAFQHSDWQRRKLMIRSCRRLADDGWQIIYLTMDDHIRDLFVEAGADLAELRRSGEHANPRTGFVQDS